MTCEKCGHNVLSGEHSLVCVFNNNPKSQLSFDKVHHINFNFQLMKTAFRCDKVKGFIYTENNIIFCPLCGDSLRGQ